MSDIHSICIIGAGPAGLMAAIESAQKGASVTIFEKGSVAGSKLLLTGGGRCNLTHEGDVAHFVGACMPYGNYLKPSFYTLEPPKLVQFFEDRGLAMVAEPNGCIFPKHGRAADVRRILLEETQRLGAKIRFGSRIAGIERSGMDFVIHLESESVCCRAIIIATGGISWPQTGSTGDGYAWAERLGHAIEPPAAILCPVVCRETWLGSLQGTSLEQAVITVKEGKRTIVCEGALVFTQDGIGGPAAFDVSRASADAINRGVPVMATLDLCPSKKKEELEDEWIRAAAENSKKEAAGLLSAYVPKRVAELLLRMADIRQQKTGSQLAREHRRRLLELIKGMPLTIVGHGSIEKATVTRGGVSHKQIDSKTMQSRLCPGLFFAGEVIDVDGPCGGYNLQIAFSTGALAGRSAAIFCQAADPCQSPRPGIA